MKKQYERMWEQAILMAIMAGYHVRVPWPNAMNPLTCRAHIRDRRPNHTLACYSLTHSPTVLKKDATAITWDPQRSMIVPYTQFLN